MALINSNTGFSLLEAMISIAVLTFSLLGLSAMQTAATRGNATADHLTASTVSGSDRIEQLLNVAYDDPLMDVGASDPITSGLPKNVDSISWNVTDWATDTVDNDGDGSTDEYDEQGIKDVAITVNYTDHGTTKTMTFNYLRARIF